MNVSDENYRNILASFRTNDLQKLLETFGQNKTGQRSELRDRALELLKSKPTGLNYVAYLTKILELHGIIQSDSYINDMMHNYSMPPQQRQMMSMGQSQTPQQRMCLLPQRPQQSMQTIRAGLPQLMLQMQRAVHGNPTDPNTIHGNTMAIKNIQHIFGRNQPAGSHTAEPSQLPINQPSMAYMMQQNTVRFVLNTLANKNSNDSTPSPQILANYKFKKLPFYEVIEDIIKPTLLNGSETCTLVNFTIGTRQMTFIHTMSPEQASLIAMNRDISYGKNEYLYQYQIRICQLEIGRNEVTDFLPLGLNIRVGNKICSLPPIASVRLGNESRRIAKPINIAQYLKLNPNISNSITINWVPDGKKYALAMFIVKKLCSDNLLKKLLDRETKSSEETKHYIIKKFTDVDPDLATTSYYFSLICPLGKTRMKIPAKSIHCDHIQCFDAATFISMNERKPTWMCPTCNKPCLYDDIRVENYFLDIVTSPMLKDDNQDIEILADGSWIISEKNKYTNNMNNTYDTKKNPIDSIDLDDSDDEISIEPKKELELEGSEKQKSINTKSHFVDLTKDEDEKPPKHTDKLENEAQAIDAKQPVTEHDLIPQIQVQPQQTVTSSGQK
ncbi:E3 SUMO-protein ligase PIAS2-like [Rhopalosiphum maidis]|uniref:E3 SUMO-protein ligase PIAS2-like n=1 Tax=Rhopalosiphum maidis TaxID=43146 RepID=UPI000F006302|nr:E3 SUMO-protein ligase PIAS2-like [Rhopalosiphum maidis]